MKKETIIGLIPARAGSKRCPGKNTRMFNGQPLIAWTIKSAKESGIFSDIWVSTDSQETIEMVSSYDVNAILRPAEFSQDCSNDYDWINHAIEFINCKDDAFGILRPTNPFRTAETIRACWQKFKDSTDAYSLRTIRESKEHPDKTWFSSADIWSDEQPYIMPYNGLWMADQPTQRLRKYYYQDGLFYINMLDNIRLKVGQVTSYPVIPYLTSYPENIDINTEEDFLEAHRLAICMKPDKAIFNDIIGMLDRVRKRDDNSNAG